MIDLQKILKSKIAKDKTKARRALEDSRKLPSDPTERALLIEFRKRYNERLELRKDEIRCQVIEDFWSETTSNHLDNS